MNAPSSQFSFEAQGKIWQIHVDSYSQLLIGEVRKEEDQSIAYFKLDLKSWQGNYFNIEEVDWWTTMLKSFPPYLLLEKYLDPQNPTEKDLLIYDYVNQRLEKLAESFQFQYLQDGKIHGYVPGSPDEKRIINLGIMQSETADLIYPTYFPPQSEGLLTILEFLEKEDQRIGAEYLEFKDCIIIAYYDRLGTNFDRKLLVMRGDVEIYHETLDKALQGFASGAFFVYRDLLIFIKNGYLLNGIRL